MPYYRRRRRTSYRRGYSGRSGSMRRYSTRRRYGRRYGRRRTASRAQRIVIQVVGGPTGVAASPISLGMKSARVVRRRF